MIVLILKIVIVIKITFITVTVNNSKCKSSTRLHIILNYNNFLFYKHSPIIIKLSITMFLILSDEIITGI